MSARTTSDTTTRPQRLPRLLLVRWVLSMRKALRSGLAGCDDMDMYGRCSFV